MAWISLLRRSKQLPLLLIALLSFGSSFCQTIFQPADVPVNPRANDGQPIETGVKFRTSQNGYITGIRYYKGEGTTGSHTGQLWSNTGTLLASQVFTNETSSGWQQILFNTPFAITAGTTYVAACYSTSGDYAITNSYFNQAVVNGPLRALANDEDGPNGVFIFSQIPMFPVNSFQASNYWVDIVFSETVGPDVFPPVVTSVTPANGSENNNPGLAVSVTFNEAIDPATINASTFELRNAANILVPASVSYSAAGTTATLLPSNPLSNSTVYTAKVRRDVKDIAGNAMANDYTWTFTTADPRFISPGEGYGGPILVISSAANPFNRYNAEILRAEGLNEFSVKDVASITAADLAGFDVVVLGEMTITDAQAGMLSNWVNAGGTLIASRPGPSLLTLFGLTGINGTLTDKYMRVNPGARAAVGIANQAIQFHGQASLYALNGATSLATLYSDAVTAMSNPAVTTINVGNNGGKAIAFAYDLARSVVYTRQGNPSWSGQKRDGQTGPVRSDDLFFPDWIDFNKIAIPQADEQQRLLANIILQSNLHRKPLPRLWYLPRQLKAAIVMTGDDHGSNGTTPRFNHYLSLAGNTPADVADWNAVRATSYIYPNTPISNAQAAAFEAQGFEIALHPTTQCENFTPSSLESNFAGQLATFASTFPRLSAPVSNRTHCMPWSDWSTHPKTEFNRGIRLDVNYYYWPASWVQNRPGMFTGSGMPMRFADSSGALVDCYQAPTQMTDESGISIGSFCDALLDKATGPEGYYGVFVANMHTDSANHTGSDAIVASALQHKVPVISAKQLLKWMDGRNNTSFSAMTWNNEQLSFTLTVPTGARNLAVMLPYYSEQGHLLSVTSGNTNVPFSLDSIKGMQYAFITVPTGTNAYIAKYSLPVPQEGCLQTSSITANFNNSSIPAGRYIWFNSVFKASNVANRAVNFRITNSRITYTLNNQTVTMIVPDGHIKFDPGANTATTNFVSNVWETKVPANTNSNVFMTGLSYRVITSLPGGIRNVKWTMDIESDRDDVSIDWKWTAGVYTNFTGNAGLNVKPTDGLLSILNPLLGIANAGTPMNYTLNIVPGAMGAGILNITNTYSAVASVSCTTNNARTVSGQALQQSPLAIAPAITPELSEIRVERNPTADYFNLIFEGTGTDIISVRIWDISGRMMDRYEKIDGRTTLRIGQNWNSGIYFAEINRNGRRKLIKLIKVN